MSSKKKGIWKWMLRGLLVMIGLILIAFTYLYINKDSITRDLLLDLNASVSGEIQVAKVDINPFVHFPYVSLSLRETKLFQTKKPQRQENEDPLLDIGQLYISFDVIKLMRSRVEVERVSAINGTLNIKRDEKGQLNIEKALQEPKTVQVSKLNPDSIPIPPKEIAAPAKEKPETDIVTTSSESKARPLELDIERLVLKNIIVTADLAPGEPRQDLSIVESRASFKYVKDTIACELDASFRIDQLSLDRRLIIEDEELRTKLYLYYDRGDEYLTINKSDIEFKKTVFHTQGSVDFKDIGMVDISFEASDQDLAFTRRFLTSEGIDNLKSGQLYLKGTAKGPFSGQIPEIRFSFGADNMTVEIPKTGDYIRDLNFVGSFNSGVEEDFSKALIILDTIHARLPTGYIRMASRLSNFKSPRLWYNLDASFRLENLRKIIDLGPVTDLRGRVTMQDSYRGALTKEAISKDLIPEEFNLELDSVGFEIPGVVDIDILNGGISGHIDSLNIDTLRIKSGDSDLVVNGAIRKLSNFIFQSDTLVSAEFKIKSDLLDFPYLFRALPNTASAFPYLIRDVYIDVGMATSRTKLENFRKVPEMEFQIREVSASVDSLLDYVRLREGKFDMYENESAFFLDFINFKLLSDGGISDAGFSFIEREGKRDSMTISLRTDGINLAQLLDTGEDSIPGLTDAWFGGDYKGTIVLPFDREDNELIHKADLWVDDFNYKAQDTIKASRFKYHTDNISYQGETTKSILATLDAENDFYFRDLETPIFQSDSLGLFINFKDAVISISPYDHDTFGDEGSGTVRIYPYEEPPKFELDYTINSLPLEDFLAAFNSEELLKGTVDIKLDLDATGLDVDSITSSLTGSIYVVGDSLMLQGLNLDDVIKDFQRSQSFNLVDIGAVVLTGPAGIVYSKGSNYVSLLSVNKNDSTQISKFSSRWSLDTGKITADDVAFATLNNRVAAQGWLDMKTDSLDFSIGILNDKGCAIYNQRIFGSSAKPEYSKVKFVKTLLAPVTNVVKAALGVKCEVFYDGIVVHPQKPEKQKK
ncbi:MAG: AsmA family protein [Flavobacteriaceae bacterium]